MLGMKLTDRASGITGIVDAEKVTPDGKAIVRVDDHWLEAEALEPAED